MDLSTIKLIREEYYGVLAEDKTYNDVLAELLDKDEYEPLTVLRDVEPEDDLSFNGEQRQLSEILLDMHTINNSIKEAKNRIQELVEEIDGAIESAQDSLNKQKEQMEDINMLCGKESLYNAVIPIYVTDFDTSSMEIIDSKTMGAAVSSSEEVPYDIISLSGNGYSGNGFVYKDGQFVSESDDRSELNYIMDDNDLTIYEYSRLCTSDKSAVVSDMVNYDDQPVTCTITLSAAESVCKMKLMSPDKNVKVIQVETSDDGITFYSRLAEPVKINDLSGIYEDAQYIYGSNTLCFPYSPYVRVTLSNAETETDEIAIEEDGTVQKINAKRKKIAIAGITLYTSEYSVADCTSVEILDGGSVDKISLFASEYVPDHFPSDWYIRYYLIVNGYEYEVEPANSGREGVTIIKYSEESSSAQESTELINETIKSVQVRIVIQPYQKGETPYVSNLKLCIGKSTGNIYV